MKTFRRVLTATVCALSARADTLYVSPSGSGTPPYADWATAAATIQDAVDAASAGDTVLVTNGVYDTGTRITPGNASLNRLLITKDITVQSVNGPEVTLIVGSAAPGGGIGPGAVRGVYMSTGILSGFTITNGHTLGFQYSIHDVSGGGVSMQFGGAVSNCVLKNNSAFRGGGSNLGTLSRCTLSGNSASYTGGGSYYSTLTDCTLSENSASSYGGGSLGGTLTDCVLFGNSAGSRGGGSCYGTLTGCRVFGNRAYDGGGSYGSTLTRCMLFENSAFYGGGSFDGTLTVCTLSGNSASVSGGGSYYSTLTHCTLSGNSASVSGGGCYDSTLTGCIAWDNTAGTSDDNWYGGTLTYSCTTPLPTGIGNVDSDPMLTSASSIHIDSPCVRSGPTNEVSGTDIDGDPWGAPPSMGCDEPLGPFGGELVASFDVPYFTVLPGHQLTIQGRIHGESVSNRWEMGDGAVHSNRVAVRHAWSTTGAYDVVLTAWNDDKPGGVSATVLVYVVEGNHYVDSGNASPVPPYTSWATAATNIQDAVDLAATGGIVWVNEGVYDTGSRATPGYACLNRLVVAHDVTVRSVNGPDVTLIVGAEATGGGNGADAVRGVYMSAGFLSGFTVTHGHTRTTGNTFHDVSGGGVNMYAGGTVSNCTLSGNSASYAGGGSYYGTLTDCTISGNSADRGGGCSQGTLTNCTISGNSASTHGGGSQGGSLMDCTIFGNSASTHGGGSSQSTLTDCTIFGNSALNSGGGSYGGILTGCTISANSAARWGGGSQDGTLNNCTLAGNSALYGGGNGGGTLTGCALSGNVASYGGGSHGGTLTNCTLSGNSASFGGGSHDGTLSNCILWGNTAWITDDNWFGGALSYSCTTPEPGGPGNITNDPMLVSASAIHADSPCIGAGSTNDVSGTDIDGEAWGTPPSIGCDEPLGTFVGDLAVSIDAPFTVVTVGHELAFQGRVAGQASSNQWTFGDGAAISNRVAVGHAWSTTGEYHVALTVWNDDHPGGVSATTLVHVLEMEVHYVNAANSSPVAPYASWATAATTIQDAVDLAANGAIVWVTNGVYDTGARATPGFDSLNRLVITNNITVHSVNGPEATLIVGAEASQGGDGADPVRGVFMSAGVLSGFTVTNGHIRAARRDRNTHSGGGVNMYYGGAVRNCVLVGNTADDGGGSAFGSLTNCRLAGNSALLFGGGSYEGTLNNCTISGNLADRGGGGGSYGGTLGNCIVWGNTAGESANNWDGPTSVFLNSCTTPLPPGTGNVTNDPWFVDAAAGDIHLLPGSPCIDAGDNALVSGAVDLDGNPRIVDGDYDGTATVDMGAYEYDGMITDTDGDAASDYEEYVADTDALDPNAFFRITSLGDHAVGYDSSGSRIYSLLWSSNLVEGIWMVVPGQQDIPGSGGADSLINPAPGEPPTFYRVEVKMP